MKKKTRFFLLITVIFILIIDCFLVYDYQIKKKVKGERIEASIISPTPVSTPMEARRFLSEQTAKSKCLERVGDYIKSNKDKKTSRDEFVWSVNSIYRICLAKNGLTPEDLLSNTKSPQINQDTYYQEPIIIEPGKTESLFDKHRREEQEKCQRDINEYNVCMNEYNAKMAEYNSCIAEKITDPYKLCFKPSKSCSKPICAY